MKIRIATRRSALALWQTNHVATQLRALPDVGEVLIVPMSTRGDEILDRSLQSVGGKGLFIKELEVAMQDGVADLAVHSMKDVPADMPPGFRIGAVLERGNCADALVSRDNHVLSRLPAGAVVGTSSLRRQAQILMLRPDIRVEAIRGNVNTRLDKLDRGDFDAIVLAVAGLERLGLAQRICQTFTPDEMLPAATQGVIGIECHSDRDDLRKVLARIDCPSTVRVTAAERAVVQGLNASCQSPLASHAVLSGELLTLTALVALPDGSRCIRDSITGDAAMPQAVGTELAAKLRNAGAGELLAEAARP